MLPKWSFGYVQSKEAYKTQDEVVGIAKKYRDLDIPLDCVVQDWNTWEPGKWGKQACGQRTLSKPDRNESEASRYACAFHGIGMAEYEFRNRGLRGDEGGRTSFYDYATTMLF